MHRTQTHSYKVTPDSDIQIDLHWIPRQGLQPVLLWLHGGALIFGSRKGLAQQQLETYLEAGYVVASADYRLAPETRLESIIEDVQDAYRWLREIGPTQAPLDLKRIGVVGHSAGGYLTLMTGCCVEPGPRALVSFYGYGDIIGDWYSRPDPFYRQSPLVPEDEARRYIGQTVLTTTGADHELTDQRWRFYLYCRQQGLWPQEVVGHDPQQEADWLATYCPVQNVTPYYPPTLLLHGDQDTDVPYEQSTLMAAALQSQGVAHELLTIPGGPHGFDHAGMDDPQVAQAFGRVIAFLDQYMMDS